MSKTVYYIAPSDSLAHYASPYYDPVKAHEYYMRTRELKGRQSTSGLNEEGKSHAAYIKEQINAERDKKLADREGQYRSDVSKAQENRDSAISLRQEAKEKEISVHTQRMKTEIAQLESKLAGMSVEDKRRNAKAIRQEIAALRNENNIKRAELNQKFGEEKVGIQNDYSVDKANLGTQYKTDRQTITREATEKYLNELMGLNDSGEFKAVKANKASKSGSSKKSSKSNKGALKSNGNVYRAKRLKEILNK